MVINVVIHYSSFITFITLFVLYLWIYIYFKNQKPKVIMVLQTKVSKTLVEVSNIYKLILDWDVGYAYPTSYINFSLILYFLYYLV